jgi:alkylation response protein AidB-like acyl-CoA dehydrogenase
MRRQSHRHGDRRRGIAKVSADLVMAYTGNVFCGLNILRKGSAEQKASWLPKLIDGKVKLSVSMSEPDARSDLSAIRTTARRDDDSNLGMQVMGGYGYNMEFDMQRHFRDSRAATMAAGTSQMQRNLIANLNGLKAR